MYPVDQRDVVVKLPDVPASDAGAPAPHVWADEQRLILQYCVAARGSAGGEAVVVVRFTRPHAHMFGPPNDEAFSGHPLASRGLGPYAAFEVEESSWVRQQERMNSVHPYHDRDRFLANRRHFIFAFHDSTFECVAEGYAVALREGAPGSLAEYVLKLLHEETV